MKARRVKGLKPDRPLADALQRIIEVRLDELCAFMPAVEDSRRVTALHDMRIAAKRLRYVLEISGGLFGPYAATATARAKEVQGVLGEIHDCDMTLPSVASLARWARDQDVAAVAAAAAAAGAGDLDPAVLSGAAGHVAAQRGLASMTVYLQARRDLLFGGFLAQWLELEREGFPARLRFAVGERPAGASSPSGDPAHAVGAVPFPRA